MVAVPLSVSLHNDRLGMSRTISRAIIGDVGFKSQVPGGFLSAECSLSEPLDTAPGELQAYTRMEVVDTRSGETVWTGRLEDPGRSSEGRVWKLGAAGPMTHAKDNTLPVIYRDRRVSQWERAEEEAYTAGTYGTQADPLGGESLMLGIPRDSIMPVGARVEGRYRLTMSSGQWVARLDSFVDSGWNNAGLLFRYRGLDESGGGGSTAVLGSWASTTAETERTYAWADGGAVYSTVEAQAYWNGAANTRVADDGAYFKVRGLALSANRVDRYGGSVPASAYAGDDLGVDVAVIIEDVLGRFLPEYDAGSATIDTSAGAQLIQQLAYENGVTASAIFDDLMALVPSHYWAAWAPNRHHLAPTFEWRPWPTDVSYDLDSDVDSFEDTGSNSDLYNEVSVRYVDGTGVSRTVVVTGPVENLDRNGLTRRGFLDLGSENGSAQQATAAGQSFLEAHRYPANSGTIKVRRPIADALTGRRLDPWSLRPGTLARVRNVAPQADSLNTQGSNGFTVFRVSGVSYSAKSNEATLTLDSYSRTVAQALARIAKDVGRARRL